MSSLFLRLAMGVALAFAACAVPLNLSAAPPPDGEVDKIRAVIVAQLQAFAADDADSAFETTTPRVRQAIGSPGHFLAMVRGAYPMVYRPASVVFLKPELDQDEVMQLVEIVDDEGKSWLALFALEQQPDSSWRINGCVVRENRWRPA